MTDSLLGEYVLLPATDDSEGLPPVLNALRAELAEWMCAHYQEFLDNERDMVTDVCEWAENWWKYLPT